MPAVCGDREPAMFALASGSRESFTDLGSPMTGNRGILIETMQLVEPKISLPVPNHILETKLYCKIAENGLIQVRPSIIHFNGFKPGQRLRKKFELLNMSNDIQKMHVIPPQTKYFNIRYTKNRRLVPGLELICFLEFYPDEYRYYYDCVKVHCQGEKNLIIPIHAYPVMNASEFPPLIDFPSVPIGETKTKVFPLRCQAPIDFEFKITYLQPHPSFRVEPMSGLVPADGSVDVYVSFTPTAYCSAIMKLQMDISQFLTIPILCTVSGHCQPGLKRDVLRMVMSAPPQLTSLDPLSITPLARARSKRLKTKTPRLTSAGTILEREPELEERDGVRFPANLNSPYAVAVVLNQKPGKLQVKDMRSAIFEKQNTAKTMTRQMKEAKFDVAVRKDTHEERQNQLRWQTKHGEEPVTVRFCSKVLAERKEADQFYKMKRGDLDEEEECSRMTSQLIWRRTRRQISDVAPPVATFDALCNDFWLTRKTAIDRFQQAARKVIVRLRMEPRVKLLDKYLREDEETPLITDASCIDRRTSDETKDRRSDDDENSNDVLDVSKITSVTFPTFVSSDARDELAVDALGVVSCKPTALRLKETVPYFALKVPQTYRLLEYDPFSVQDALSDYVPPTLVRSLRTGAEDELINLPIKPRPNKTLDNADLVVSTKDASQVSSLQALEVIILTPPKAIFEPIKYHQLHIFNPIPGLMSYQNNLPYSETDPDFHLCPLPRFVSSDPNNPHMATQKQYLNREDIIGNTATWKRFSSSSLTSLSHSPSLTNVWVPRWKDPFGRELLPFSVPLLFDSISEEDKMNVVEKPNESGDGLVYLTMEMVKAQFSSASDSACASEEDLKEVKEIKLLEEIPVVAFPNSGKLPSNNLPSGDEGPIPREQRQSDLEAFLRTKFDILGGCIRSRIDRIDRLKKKKSLIPK